MKRKVLDRKGSVPMSISQELAAFAVDVQTQSIDPAVQREALRAAFNWVGCAVGGRIGNSTA